MAPLELPKQALSLLDSKRLVVKSLGTILSLASQSSCIVSNYYYHDKYRASGWIANETYHQIWSKPRQRWWIEISPQFDKQLSESSLARDLSLLQMRRSRYLFHCYKERSTYWKIFSLFYLSMSPWVSSDSRILHLKHFFEYYSRWTNVIDFFIDETIEWNWSSFFISPFKRINCMH